MLGWIVLVFGVTAGGGLVLAGHVFRGKLPPVAVAAAHGLLGAAGLILLVFSVLAGAGSIASTALVILVVAALGGFFLASFHLRQAVPPKAGVIVHALVAVTGFLFLLYAAGVF